MIARVAATAAIPMPIQTAPLKTAVHTPRTLTPIPTKTPVVMLSAFIVRLRQGSQKPTRTRVMSLSSYAIARAAPTMLNPGREP